jgi:hypothetical protein
MSYPERLVVNRLNNMNFPGNRYTIHKGFIERTLQKENGSLPNEISFAYVDLDFYIPIKNALAFLHNKLNTGSVIFVDDYDYFSTGAKKAVDEFINENNSSQKNYVVDIPNTNFGYFAIITKI